MRRREFLKGAVVTAVLIPVLSACDEAPTGDDTGESDTDDTGPLTCVMGDGEGEATTHGHRITIPQADLDDPQDRTYTSTFGSGHNHQVPITAAEMEELVENCTVRVRTDGSVDNTHSHTWDIFLPES